MDVYMLLHQDHVTVKAIFEELEEKGERAEKKRGILFTELNLEWTVHSMAEEKFLYPLLMEKEATRALSQEAVEAHLAMQRQFKELEADDKTTDHWLAKLKLLRETVERHIEEEEVALFGRARTVIGDTEAERLAAEIDAYKEEQILTLEF